MKHIEIEDDTELRDFLGLPDRDWTGVVLQAPDLSEQDDTLAAEDLTKSTAFIGCTFGVALAKKAADVGCLLLSPRNGLPYNPYRHAVYSWRALLDCYSPADPESYRSCLDWLAYETAMDETTKKKRADLTLADELLFRLHDFSQEDALLDFLKPVSTDATTWKKVVAIMGGHDLERQEKLKNATGAPTSDDAPYMRAALLAWQLTQAGYVIATGGGPGAMEAGNLGAFFGHRPEEELRAAVRKLQEVPKVKPIAEGSPRWNSGERQFR